MKDQHSLFVGRKVRKYFETNNLKHRHRLQVVEGVVERYLKDKSLFRIRYVQYDTNGSDADRQDLDLAALEAVIFVEVQEEIFHNNVPDPELERLLVSGSTPLFRVRSCYTTISRDRQQR